MSQSKRRAPRNRTLTLTADEVRRYSPHLLTVQSVSPLSTVLNRVIHQTMEDTVEYLPDCCVDLLILDPPYNLTKQFGEQTFRRRDDDIYCEWAENWLMRLIPCLKPTASIYVCADWRTSALWYGILKQHFIVQNRITWEREKGRGAKTNWKNSSEDIWFCTVSKTYTFNIDAVKLKRRVIAPYRHQDGTPKDWHETDDGNYRLTHPSNLWTDISVPFWSMPENTDHPTQKPEKLIAKLVLASSNEGDVVLDPFLGSGTTAVVARKLGRDFIGIERELEYACLALKRLERAETERTIQGYANGVFLERNTPALPATRPTQGSQLTLDFVNETDETDQGEIGSG